MLNNLRRWPAALAIGVALSAAAGTPGRAQPTPNLPTPNLPTPAGPNVLTLDALSGIVAGMGYEVKADPNGKNFTIPIHSNYNYIVNFALSSDGTFAWIFVNLGNFTPDQLERLQTVKLLEASDAGPGNFTLGKGESSDTLYAQRILPSMAITSALLRSTFDNLVQISNNNDTLWNKNLWK